jgi:hypothetical protein
MLIMDKDFKILVYEVADSGTASVTNKLRDDIKELVREYLTKKVKYFELEYQPA